MFSRKLVSCSGLGPKRPLVGRVSWLAAAVLVAGCGSPAPDPDSPHTPLSCTDTSTDTSDASSDTRTDSPLGANAKVSRVCIDYTGAKWTLSNIDCPAPATSSTSACSSANMTGSCTREAGSDREVVVRFYSSSSSPTTASAQSWCTANGGIFEEPPDPPCTPNCTGKTCGSDGCDGSCGTCAGRETCSAGTCSSPPPVCRAAPTTNECTDGSHPRACGIGCGGPACDFACPGVSQCFPTEAAAHVFCGDSCHACAPNPCHAAPPATNACTDDSYPRYCGISCGGAGCDFVCPDVDQCFPTAGAARAACAGSCHACGPVPD